ncbi:MAG: hypothetical protein JXA06_08810 [Bacteroidetes bacterium]|nr:hypothetical protein [Bacteroidota bacterium]
MEEENRFSFGQLGVGVFILIVGVILLLNNFNVLDTASAWDFWPVILIIIGLGKLLDARLPHEYHKGFWMLFLGTWFLISELHIFGLDYSDSWPILMIGIGIGILWKSFYPSQKTAEDHCHGT